MPLDPQARMVIDQLEALGAPPLHEQTVEDARAALAMFSSMGGPGEQVAGVEDRTVPGPAGEIPVRVYTPALPAGQARLPGVIYFHGGGWVLGGIETHDGACRTLADAAGAVVVSVDYRLAPEHRFPAAAEDCYSATAWVHEHAAEIGVDRARLAVAGDSSGGNLAAVAALMARERDGPPLVFQLLVYPATDSSLASASMEENAEGYLLTRDDMRWFWGLYLGDADGGDPHASPALAGDLSGLPPALVITAEYDPLRDEGEAYAARLREAGVETMASRFDGQVHGFFEMTALFDASRKAVDQAATALKEAFAS